MDTSQEVVWEHGLPVLPYIQDEKIAGRLDLHAIETYLWELPEPIRFLLAGALNTIVGYALFVFGLFLFSGPLQALGSP